MKKKVQNTVTYFLGRLSLKKIFVKLISKVNHLKSIDFIG